MQRIAAAACGLIAIVGCQHPATTGGPPAATFPAAISGLGTEPFWSVEIDGGQFAWSSAEAPSPRRTSVTRREQGGRLAVAGSLDGKAVSGEITKAGCSDGMSDRRYPFTLTIAIGDTTFEGCAYPRGMQFPPS